jgi:hypothetical protein
MNKNFCYIDKTWLDKGHVTNKVWVNSGVKFKEQAFLSDLPTGIKKYPRVDVRN